MNIVLNSGGSVANDAFSFLVECGIKNIILIGQDLAYPGKKTHISSAYEDEKRINLNSKKVYFDVEDVYGNMVSTEENMVIYRKWFEMAIRNNPQLNVIDATEGGAKIEGTNIMSFADVISEYIEELPFTDFEKKIDSISELPKDIVDKRIEKILNFEKEISETRASINKVLSLYDELDLLNRKNKQSSERFMKVAKEIEDETTRIEQSVLGCLMIYSQGEDEMEVLTDIYEDKKSVYEEVKFIIDSGRKVLCNYLEKYDEISEKVSQMVADVREKM